MAEPGLATQKALFVALEAGLSVPVYDHVPQGINPPYVVIERLVTDDASALTARRDRRFYYLSVWSTYRGQKEVLEQLAAIDAALHDRQLTLDTGRMVIARVIRKHTSRDADGRTFMGQATVEILTEH
jgi:hypothetical protein